MAPQLVWLVQKNFLLQWRHKRSTIMSVVFPLIFFSLLVAIRTVIEIEDIDAETFPRVDASPAGITSDFVCSEVSYNGFIFHIPDTNSTLGQVFTNVLKGATTGAITPTIIAANLDLAPGVPLTANATTFADSLYSCLPATHECFTWPSVQEEVDRACISELIEAADFDKLITFFNDNGLEPEILAADYETAWDTLIAPSYYLPYGVPNEAAVQAAKVDEVTANGGTALTPEEEASIDQYFALVDDQNLYMRKTIGYVLGEGVVEADAVAILDQVVAKYQSEAFTASYETGGGREAFTVPSVGFTIELFATEADLEQAVVERNRPTVETNDAGDQEEQTQEELIAEFASTVQKGGNITAAVVFNRIDALNFDYTIRMLPKWGVQTNAGLSTFYTNLGLPEFMPLGSGNERGNEGREFRYYMTSGYTALQAELERAYILVILGASTAYDNIKDPESVMMKQFAYPAFQNDIFIFFIAELIPFFVWLSFILSIFNVVRELVFEKEARLREAMRMMGLSDWVNTTAWFIKSGVQLLITTFFFTIAVKYGNILAASDFFVLWAFFYMYALSLVAFGFLLASFFSTANVAAFASIGVYFLAFFPQFFVNRESTYRELDFYSKMAVGLLFPTNMGLGMRIFSQLENRGTGGQFATLFEPISPQDDFSLGYVMLMFCIDIVFYMIMAWYITNVFPGEFGIPKKPWFLFEPEFWLGAREEAAGETDLEMVATDGANTSDSFEKEPEGLRPSLQIRGLTKEFIKGGKKFTAVNNLSATMYEDQITALLGHNGAGKTTTISMLTGLFPPTKGDAFLNGKSIRTQMNEVRGSLGICPQFDIVWPDLTVAEHLFFYARLKGQDGPHTAAEVDEMIADIGLKDKRDTFSSDLSGGMRRRLSVGMALIGGSKIVFLDEPTSGQDPHARRGTWDLLFKHKKGRTIILTTHFMDEADLLGDRVAIMTDGMVQCNGSSLFLKTRYGSGYRLTIAKNPELTCDVDAITSTINDKVTGAACVSDVGTELAFTLPADQAGNFAGVFESLDAKTEDYGIQSYGVAMTTMEEVFLKVGADSHDASLGLKDKAGETIDAVVMDESKAVKYELTPAGAPALVLRHFLIMIRKRFWYALRDYMAIIWQLVLPVGFILLALITAIFNDPFLPDPELVFGLNELYAKPFLPFIYDATSDNAKILEFGQQFANAYNAPLTDFSNNAEILEFAASADCAANTDSTLSCAMDGYTQLEYKREPNIKQTMINAIEINDVDDGDCDAGADCVDIIINYQPLAYHSIPIGINARSNAIANLATGGSVDIVSRNHPFLATKDSNAQAIAGGFGSFFTSFSALLGMSFLSSSFVLFLIAERKSGAKHLQLTSGVSIVTYWLGSLIWDMLNTLVVCALLCIVFAVMGVPEYIAQLGHVFLINVFYIFGNMPFAYFMTFATDSPGLGFGIFFVFNYIAGLGTLILTLVFGNEDLGLSDINDVLKYVLLVIPSYAYPKAMADIYSNEQAKATCQGDVEAICAEFGIVKTDSVVDLNMPGIGSNYLALFLTGVVGFVLLILFEKWQALRSGGTVKGQSVDGEHEDVDVVAERHRMKAADYGDSGDVVSIKGLTKIFSAKKRPAVNDLWVGIPKQQCFGLLGINGAGKTTTFKMITGDIAPSAGDAVLDGFSSNKELAQVRQRVGYCPQFDALIDKLTGRETLKMYATLRGVPTDKIDALVNESIIKLDLTKHCDSQCGSYSGGNKRKLSTALAMIGDPKILLLDEPSTGMDPGARRFIWNTINNSMNAKGGRSIVLTSHSMEECEALCTRLAIMVNGQFKCLGSLQHLKTRFGGEVSLMLKVDEKSQVPALQDWVKETFPSAEVKDIHNTLIEYSVSRDVPWGELFGKVEDARGRLNICDYGISQPTLEQIFLKFAATQNDEEGEGDSNEVQVDDNKAVVATDDDDTDVEAQVSVAQSKAAEAEDNEEEVSL